MSRKAFFRPAAQVEFDHQAEHLALHAGEAVAQRFIDAVEATVRTLLKSPAIGGAWISEHERLQGIRNYRVGGFPNHRLFYRHDGDVVEILHIYHGAQNIASRMGGDDASNEGMSECID